MFAEKSLQCFLLLTKNLDKHCLLFASRPRLPTKRYHDAQQQDDICSRIITFCKKGWPKNERMSRDMLPYWHVRGNSPSAMTYYFKENTLLFQPGEKPGEDPQQPSRHSTITPADYICVWCPMSSMKLNNLCRIALPTERLVCCKDSP